MLSLKFYEQVNAVDRLLKIQKPLHLRQRSLNAIDPAFAALQTVRGVGYRFQI